MELVSAAKLLEELPKGWKKVLKDEFQKDYFQELFAFIDTEYKGQEEIYPPQARIFRALEAVDYADVKVVILGQDPYHGPGQAVGLSFAVPNDLKKKPPSLLNIFKEIESDLKTKVDYQKSELSHWASEGVLLLNTVLTVKKGQAFSHRNKGWEIFTDRVISVLNKREEPLIFLLWGTPARKKRALITNFQHYVLESAHPSPLSAYNGFFGSRPFSKTNKLLSQLHKAPIHWEMTS
jgi:uracil-DNA glycosylase